LFGGNDGSISNKCFVVKLNGDFGIKIEAAPFTLAGAAEFVFSAVPISDGEHIYAVDSNRNLHIFDCNENKWEMITKTSWHC